jgi:hypothetical protein
VGDVVGQMGKEEWVANGQHVMGGLSLQFSFWGI